MNRAHPNFGLKTKISEKEWWRKLIRGTQCKGPQKLLREYFHCTRNNFFTDKNCIYLIMSS
jgi:hypothetical protein